MLCADPEAVLVMLITVPGSPVNATLSEGVSSNSRLDIVSAHEHDDRAANACDVRIDSPIE